MSDTQQGPGWWQASDGKWYGPESHPDYRPGIPSLPPPSGPALAPTAPVQSAPQAFGATGTPAQNTKRRKQFYKRWWFIAAALFVLLIVVVAIVAPPKEDNEAATDGSTLPT